MKYICSYTEIKDTIPYMIITDKNGVDILENKEINGIINNLKVIKLN